jgi:hypothetical protein
MVAELSLESGSASVAATDAVLLREPVDSGVTTMLAVAEDPIANPPKLHVTVGVPLHEPCVALAEANVTPGGSMSVNIAFVAGDGPLLVTTIR